ncbi:cupin domain-containing protein [Pseudotabrizicola formosa]|uniref:cupin domain-containing protein n=1 Tax=Pseudotabrizicola formosa TaxID=2030009 RepID=UPI000CD194E6|nr:cupin domain-containing protein [Pseudotabrizicola formosa]
MPHFPLADALTDESDGTDSPTGPYRAHLLSDTGGLTQFGAFIEILPPGSGSSVKHWHANEDEMIHMLAGEVTLQEGDTSTILRPGDTATFKAGMALGHCLHNHSTAEARYLVIGTRGPSDVITYPDHDRVLHFNRNPLQRRYTDLQGQPADSPYRKPD